MAGRLRAASPVGLRTVGAQLLGQGPVPVAESGHQAGPELHLNLTGVGADGVARPAGVAAPGMLLSMSTGSWTWTGTCCELGAAACPGRSVPTLAGAVLRLLLEDEALREEASRAGRD